MTTTHLKSILLLGGTTPYGFGQHVVQALLNQRLKFDRVAVYHDLSRPTSAEKQQLIDSWKTSGLEIITAQSFEDSAPFQGFDTVMLLLGQQGLHLQPQIIDLAIAAGVRHFYPSEYGADLEVGTNRHMRYYLHKIQTREHLLARSRDVPDLSWTYFLLGRLAEWALLPHFGVHNKHASARIYGSPKGRQSLIATRDAAEFLVATLGIPLVAGEHGARIFRVSGGSPTYAEIFATVKQVRGVEYDVAYLDVEDARVEEAEAKAKGDLEGELSASHKLIQGLEGTLLPQPWDNARLPGIALTSLEYAFRAAFESNIYRIPYGLDPL